MPAAPVRALALSCRPHAMPWTLAHPAAILPLRRFAPRWLSLPALILFFATVRITLVRARREEHNLALHFGDAYLAYRARVPFIFPLRPPLRAARPR